MFPKADPRFRLEAATSQLVRLSSVKLPEPSVVPTPFSKKQPPPKERPTVVTSPAAMANAAAPMSWTDRSSHSPAPESDRPVRSA